MSTRSPTTTRKAPRRPRAKVRDARPVAPEEARVRLSNDARRAQLLTLGLEMFSERPWDEVQIDDVARAAGISKGLLYHYFPTKRDFYLAVVRDAAERLVDATETPESTPPFERLTTGLSRYLDFVERRATAYATLLRGGIGTDTDTADIVERTRQAFLLRAVRGLGLDEPPPALRLALRGWVGFVEATSLDWLDRRDVARDALLALWARALVALVASVAEG